MTITADILDEPCDSLAAWTESNFNGGDVSVSPAGHFLFQAPVNAGGSYGSAYVVVDTAPSQHTIEIETICDNVNTIANEGSAFLLYTSDTWQFNVYFASNGLFITKAGGVKSEIGTDLVNVNPLVSQIWRFQIDKSSGDASAVVEVFLEGVSQGSFDCDFQQSSSPGYVWYFQYGKVTDTKSSHIKYIKIGTGLGEFASGVVYEEDADDSITVSDSPSRVQTSNKTKSDSITVSDSPSRVQTSNKTKSDSITVGDVLSSAQTFNIAKGDSIAVSDVLSSAQTFNIAKGDSITVGDSSSRVQTSNKAKADSITVGDSLSRAQTSNIAKGDSITVGDVLLKNEGKNKSESLLMGDVFSYIKGSEMGVVEFPAVIDTLSKQDDKNKSDSIIVGDSLSKSIGKDKSEFLTIIDSPIIGEALGMNDHVSIDESLLKSVSIKATDFLTAGESLSKREGKDITDFLTAGESLSKREGKPSSDSILLGDEDKKQYNKNKSDSIIITDSPADGYELYADDSILASDLLSKWKTPVLLSIDIMNLETEMSVGTAHQLKAIGYYDDGSEADITFVATWVSSNEDVATIDYTGLIIISIARGISFITAYLDTVYGRILKTLMIRVGIELDAISNITADDITNLQLIPLDPSPNQTFNSVLTVDGRNINLQFQLRWNIPAQYWVMTLIDADVGDYLVDGIPLTTGVIPTINLLQPYSYLGIGSCYILNVSGIKKDYPDEFNLGTDYVMLWGNTES